MSETLKMEKTAWRWFADAHPHEASELDWPRFVAYARRKVGRNVSEVEIRELLKETEREMTDTLPPQTEEDFQKMVEDTAHLLGWKTFSLIQSAAISAKTGKIISMVTKRGWPDLVLVKGNKIIFWELKADKGKLSPEQREWLTALEAVKTVHQVGCVRPRDWKLIEETLRE